MYMEIAREVFNVFFPEEYAHPFLDTVYAKFGVQADKEKMQSCIDVHIQKGDPVFARTYPLKTVRKAAYYVGPEGNECIITGPFFSMHVDTEKNELRLFDHCSTCRNTMLSAFIGGMRLYVSLSCIERGGIPLHGSGIRLANNGAVIFTGDSGSGKTTLVRLLRKKGIVLNDEFTILLPHEDGSYHAYGTPFTSSTNVRFSAHDHAPLSAIFFIAHADRTYTVDLTFRDIILHLVKNTYSLPVINEQSDALLSAIERLAMTIPCRMLYFSTQEETVKDLLTVITET